MLPAPINRQERSFLERSGPFNDASQMASGSLGRFRLCALQFPAMANLTSVVKQLEQERNHLSTQLERLNNALSALNPSGNSAGRKVSAAGRRKMAAAQKARWAKWRKAHKKG